MKRLALILVVSLFGSMSCSHATTSNSNKYMRSYGKKDKDSKIVIPEDRFSLVEYMIDNHRAIALVNTAMKDFEPKDIFKWRCSIIINLENTNDGGMPTNEELQIVYKLEDYLTSNIKGDSSAVNALFLYAVTCNGTRQLVYRVKNPEITNNFLQQLIYKETNPRHFEYMMNEDREWVYDKEYLVTKQ